MNLPVCLSLASLDLLLQKIFVERCWSQICQKMGREMHPHQTRSNLDCTIFIKNYTKTYHRVMKRNMYYFKKNQIQGVNYKTSKERCF